MRATLSLNSTTVRINISIANYNFFLKILNARAYVWDTVAWHARHRNWIDLNGIERRGRARTEIMVGRAGLEPATSAA